MTKPMGVRIIAIGSFGLAEIAAMKVLDSFVVTVLYLLTRWGAMEAEELGSRPCHHTVRARCCLRVASMARPGGLQDQDDERWCDRNDSIQALHDASMCKAQIVANLSRDIIVGAGRKEHKWLLAKNRHFAH